MSVCIPIKYWWVVPQLLDLMRKSYRAPGRGLIIYCQGFNTTYVYEDLFGPEQYTILRSYRPPFNTEMIDYTDATADWSSEWMQEGMMHLADDIVQLQYKQAWTFRAIYQSVWAVLLCIHVCAPHPFPVELVEQIIAPMHTTLAFLDPP